MVTLKLTILNKDVLDREIQLSVGGIGSAADLLQSLSKQRLQDTKMHSKDFKKLTTSATIAALLIRASRMIRSEDILIGFTTENGITVRWSVVPKRRVVEKVA